MDWAKLKLTLKDYMDEGHKRTPLERESYRWWNEDLTTPQRKSLLVMREENPHLTWEEQMILYKGKEHTIPDRADELDTIRDSLWRFFKVQKHVVLRSMTIEELTRLYNYIQVRGKKVYVKRAWHEYWVEATVVKSHEH